MAPRFKPYPRDYYQSQLFPANVFELLPKDHECFLYRELFEQLDTSEVEAQYSERGQRAYPPHQIVSILIYAYSHGVFSSRQIEKHEKGTVAFSECVSAGARTKPSGIRTRTAAAGLGAGNWRPPGGRPSGSNKANCCTLRRRTDCSTEYKAGFLLMDRNMGSGAETKIAHLQMIQAVITRMAGNSFMVKGWTVTLVTALFALAAAAANGFFVYVAYLPAVMFWSLDAYFLRQERLFRKLYDHVREVKDGTVDFSMNTHPFKVGTTWSVAWSRTLCLFHGTITTTIIVVMLVLMGP